MVQRSDEETADRPNEPAEVNPGRQPHGELFYMMHELSRFISIYFDHAMAQHQLTHAQWWAMMHVTENEGTTQSELAAIMQMGRASAGKLLERLEAKGWIERRPDAADHRVRRVYVVRSKPEVLNIMSHEGGNLFNDFLVGISEEEERAMLVGLRKMKANAERHLGSGGQG